MYFIRVVEKALVMDTESLQYRIPAFGSHVVAVLFNPVKWDGELVPLGNGIPSEEVQASYLSRGLQFVGCFGFLSGRFVSAWECQLEGNAIEFLARCYCEWLYKTQVTQAPMKLEADASIAWLKSLYQLSDPRKEN